MSVYIPGMEMPKNCLECPIVVCLKPKDDCPLVEIPPHGRLIDGDVAEAICFTDEDAEGKDFYDGILYAADFISQQPTIIPAEEGE